ncbi:MAG: hypothetical protein GY929_07640 [Actinomycetia bacterium]|nr:hypothetical protein [Actinomycetes bacterium]
MPERLRPILDQRRRLAVGVLATIILAVPAAWAIDSLILGDSVARNVSLDGTQLSGSSPDTVLQVVEGRAASYAATPAVVTTDTETLETTAIEIGAHVDVDATVDAVLDANKGGFILARPARWLGSLFSTTEVYAVYSVDNEAVSTWVDGVSEGADPPSEPQLRMAGGRYVIEPGQIGSGISVDDIAPALVGVVGQTPLAITVPSRERPPTLSDADASELAERANELTGSPLTVQVETAQVSVESGIVRSWTSAEIIDGELELLVSERAVLLHLEPLDAFAELTEPGGDAIFEVVTLDPEGRAIGPDGAVIGPDDDDEEQTDNAALPGQGGDEDEEPELVQEIRIVPGEDGFGCCAEGSGDRVQAALVDGSPTVVLELGPRPPRLGIAEAQDLGIVEKIGEFTTKHPCCQGRVDNIQNFADIVRGVIIEPGQELSLNTAVGQRTREGGFVPAGAIAQGVMEAQVGGGVSQFATTFFNAAFFSGLDFVEYQSHSLYFSRYPRGREATISWTKPDLVVSNPTPYGVLVWTSYTDTTITVSMWSTRFVEGFDLGRREGPQGACTRVVTTRERVWTDGREPTTDEVFAVYRPGEGLDCAGNSTRPTTTTTATTLPPGGTTTTAPTTATTTATTAGTTTTTAAAAPTSTSTTTG